MTAYQQTPQNSISISTHAYIRAKERFRWNKKTTERMAQKAFINGENTKNPQISYLVKGKKTSSKGTKIGIVGNIIFVFSEKNCLITLFPVKEKTRQKQNKIS